MQRSLKLNVQLKFPDQVKKIKSHGFPSVLVEVVGPASGTPLDVEHIRQQICESAGFKDKLLADGIDASCIDLQNSNFIFQGTKISNSNIGALLPAQTLSSDAHAAAPATTIVWKISVKAAARQASPPRNQQQPAGPHRSDLTKFCTFLRGTNAQLVKEFFAGSAVVDNISGTNVFKIASRRHTLFFETDSREHVDSISYCVQFLSELKILHELYVARRKALNKEELGIQKYALDNGRVQRLNLHRTNPKLFDSCDNLPSSPHAQASTPCASAPPHAFMAAGPGCGQDPPPAPTSVSKTNRRLGWTYSQRLHHKLHDMLMFDIAELELDGKPYRGKSDDQNPKRDPQHSEKSRGKKLTAYKANLEQMLSEAQELGYESLLAPLQMALDATAQLQAEPAPAQTNAPGEQWFSKENAWHSLEDIMHCWRNSTAEKKVMPHPLSVLCKKAFDSKKKTTISLDQAASLLLEEFASELNGEELTSLLMQIDAAPNRDVTEAEVLRLVQNLRNKGNKTPESGGKQEASASQIFALFKPAFEAAGSSEAQAGKKNAVIKLKQVGDIVLKEFASDVNAQELVALLKMIVTDRRQFDLLKTYVGSCPISDDCIDESRFLHFVDTYLKAFVCRQMRQPESTSKQPESTSNQPEGSKKFSKQESPNVFKQAFAAALKKGCSTVRLNQVAEIVELAFASEVNEVKYLELVKRLQAQIGVRDVVDFYDKLVKIEEERKEAQKPPKLEFCISSKDQRHIDMYRILDSIQHQTIHDENIRDSAGNLCEHRLMFSGQILVRCASMKDDDDFRKSYLDSIKEINHLQGINEERLKEVSSNISVLSLFLFILARARIHASLKMCDPEIEATSSLGLAGIKQFQHFMSKSIFEAESAAYRDLGICLASLDVMRASPEHMLQTYGVKTKTEDAYHTRARFRELCFASLKEMKLPNDSDCVKFMREPFRHLKKSQPVFVRPIDVASSTKGDTFSVATVTSFDYFCLVCVRIS